MKTRIVIWVIIFLLALVCIECRVIARFKRAVPMYVSQTGVSRENHSSVRVYTIYSVLLFLELLSSAFMLLSYIISMFFKQKTVLRSKGIFNYIIPITPFLRYNLILRISLCLCSLLVSCLIAYSKAPGYNKPLDVPLFL